ncbi:MAG: hypothetical protein ACPHTD_04075 [Gammaproteobacteria bacterium]
MKPVPLTLICALPSEARPLIRHFALREVESRPFRLLTKDHISLLVSGVGAHASACAVGYAAGRLRRDRSSVWLNVGIAGHASLPLGSAVLAGCISHTNSDIRYYPGLCIRTALPVAPVLSHDEPVSNYPDEACCDMEAAGFMAATARIADPDLVQVIKVISDNSHSPLDAINREMVEGLVTGCLTAVDEVAAELRALAARLPSAPDYSPLDALCEQVHFTATERELLQRHYARWQVISEDAPWPAAALSTCGNASAVLGFLQAQLAALSAIETP